MEQKKIRILGKMLKLNENRLNSIIREVSDDVRGVVEDLDEGASLQTAAYEKATPRQQVKFLLKLVQNNIINITFVGNGLENLKQVEAQILNK